MNQEEIREEHEYIGFFTVTILKWQRLLKLHKYKQIILDSLKYLVEQKKIKVYAFVIMPNHIHLLWKINEPYLLEDVQRDFLKFTGQAMYRNLLKNHKEVLALFRVDLKDRKYQFWKRNSLTTFLYYRKTIEQKLDYIHNNPVQGIWELAESLDKYPYSSYNFYEFDDTTTYPFLTHYMEEFE
ncbi:transposase [Bernardetia sp. ABR2-2B]|uniref:transposase n=1 Tax=Bernardetia sp. ABR2-2B TaxID=3127472 RepID=UPI0030D30C83